MSSQKHCFQLSFYVKNKLSKKNIQNYVIMRLILQVAVTITNKVYTWGCHPYGLRHFVHHQRKARMAGKQVFEQAESHLKPQLVDTSYVHGRIKQVGVIISLMSTHMFYIKKKSTLSGALSGAMTGHHHSLIKVFIFICIITEFCNYPK